MALLWLLSVQSIKQVHIVALNLLSVLVSKICAVFYVCVTGEDFNIIQQEIAILSDCKHSNIVGYLGSYLR